MTGLTCGGPLRIARTLSLFQWRIISRLMMWIYRRDLPWRKIPMLLLLLGVLTGGVAAVLLHMG